MTVSAMINYPNTTQHHKGAAKTAADGLTNWLKACEDLQQRIRDLECEELLAYANRQRNRSEHDLEDDDPKISVVINTHTACDPNDTKEHGDPNTRTWSKQVVISVLANPPYGTWCARITLAIACNRHRTLKLAPNDPPSTVRYVITVEDPTISLAGSYKPEDLSAVNRYFEYADNWATLIAKRYGG